MTVTVTVAVMEVAVRAAVAKVGEVMAVAVRAEAATEEAARAAALE